LLWDSGEGSMSRQKHMEKQPSFIVSQETERGGTAGVSLSPLGACLKWPKDLSLGTVISQCHHPEDQPFNTSALETTSKPEHV
jgi:hypothetical protein